MKIIRLRDLHQLNIWEFMAIVFAFISFFGLAGFGTACIISHIM